jgi:hypothetical protein
MRGKLSGCTPPCGTAHVLGGLAVSQKDLEKVLTETMTPEELKMLQKMRARIDFIGDIEDVKKLSEQLK